MYILYSFKFKIVLYFIRSWKSLLYFSFFFPFNEISQFCCATFLCTRKKCITALALVLYSLHVRLHPQFHVHTYVYYGRCTKLVCLIWSCLVLSSTSCYHALTSNCPVSCIRPVSGILNCTVQIHMPHHSSLVLVIALHQET